MAIYVQYNEDNSIAAYADWPAPGMVEVDFEVVRGYDGKLYEKGKEPSPTAKEQAEWRKNEILAELDRIDRASSRALRAVLTAQSARREPDASDVERLAGYEAEAKALRAELAGLEV